MQRGQQQPFRWRQPRNRRGRETAAAIIRVEATKETTVDIQVKATKEETTPTISVKATQETTGALQAEAVVFSSVVSSAVYST